MQRFIGMQMFLESEVRMILFHPRLVSWPLLWIYAPLLGHQAQQLIAQCGVIVDEMRISTSLLSARESERDQGEPLLEYHDFILKMLQVP